MMFTLAIVNQKGGVGKTTTAVTLGHGLALSGMEVVVVDLDAQGNVADALGMKKEGGLYRLLFERHGRPAVIRSGRERLDVVLGDKTTVEAKQRLAGMDFRERALGEALEGLELDYDVAILDVAPGVDVLQVGALVACDGFLIPVALSHLAVVGAGDALASAGALWEMNALGGLLLGVLPTFWERKTKESHQQLESLVEQYGDWVWPPIPDDVKAREAPAYGETLWEYAPSCRALYGTEINGKTERVGGYVQVLGQLMDKLHPTLGG